MKKIQIRLNEDELKLAEAKRLIEGFTTVSEMAKRKVLEFDIGANEKITVTNNNSKTVSIYLYEHEIELIKRYAKISGMSFSREVAFRVRKTLIKDSPCLYLTELNDLKLLKNSVDRIGRNVHFIISGDRFVEVNDDEFRKEINDLLKNTEEIKKLLESLVNSAINRFG